MIEVKRIVYDEYGRIKEVEFYPGTDLANASLAIEEMRLQHSGPTDERAWGIINYIEKRRASFNEPKSVEYPPSPKQDAS